MIKKLLEHIVGVDDADKTIKQILANLNISRRIIIQVKNINGIKLNGGSVTINASVKLNDIIELMIEDSESENIIPEQMDFDIVHEDNDLLLINKPAGIVVHPTTYHFTGTLANGVVYYFNTKGLNCKFRAVNRLDKDTSGLVLICKSQLGHSVLSSQLINKTFKKEYLAVVHNKFEGLNGTINEPISRKPGSIIERYVNESGQHAFTCYKVLSQNDESAAVRVNLLTGRTHQIRVHFSYIGHALYGDEIYGTRDNNISRHALHCSRLEFLHPISKQLMIFECGLPDDIIRLIDNLGLCINENQIQPSSPNLFSQAW